MIFISSSSFSLKCIAKELPVFFQIKFSDGNEKRFVGIG
jgi:hypothetical protein